MDHFEIQQANGVIVKALVWMNVGKPLKKGSNAGSRKDGNFWVDFKYERLAQFCYYCGMIGHEEKGCAKAIMDEKNGGGKSLNLGPRLKVKFSRWRVRTTKNMEEEWMRGS